MMMDLDLLAMLELRRLMWEQGCSCGQHLVVSFGGDGNGFVQHPDPECPYMAALKALNEATERPRVAQLN